VARMACLFGSPTMWSKFPPPPPLSGATLRIVSVRNPGAMTATLSPLRPMSSSAILFAMRSGVRHILFGQQCSPGGLMAAGVRHLNVGTALPADARAHRIDVSFRRVRPKPDRHFALGAPVPG
jgi:hypothetical protein